MKLLPVGILMGAILGLAPAFGAGARTGGVTSGGRLRMAIRADPKMLDPAQVAEEPSDMVRYMTAGVLVRMNRITQKLEPGLATSWKVLEGGRRIRFELRPGVRFSDGSALDSADVAASLDHLFDPAVHSPTAEAFHSGKGRPVVTAEGPLRVSVRLAAPLGGIEAAFDGVAISPAEAVANPAIYARVTAGPFCLKEHKGGQYVLLARNPHYWKRDARGAALPYLDEIELDVLSNREIEYLRFRRGELHLMKVDPDIYERLAKEAPETIRDAGASLEAEQIWFNMVPGAPLPDFKKRWFASSDFRVAVSGAIRRDDIVRIVYKGRGRAAAGPVSPANRFWFNKSLDPIKHSPEASLTRLRKAGFKKQGAALVDAGGNSVEFSLITNAGNKTRERIAALVRQDLAAIGIKVNVVPLDFPSLIERISKSWNYEACLLGLVNVGLDPLSVMNIWLSSAATHQWNPSQAKPATPWEAEIDRLMIEQAASGDLGRRKELFDRVQAIAREHEPFVYLANRNALGAVQTGVGNVKPTPLYPQLHWNIEELYLAGEAVSGQIR